MSEIKVDKGIPIPAARRGRNHVSIYPWTEVGVGDSFFVPGATTNKKGHGGTALNVVTGRKQVPGSKWATRTVTENGVRGLRVWRTA